MAHHQPLRRLHRRISYCPEGDRWRAVLQSGIQVQGKIDVATKAEAIAAALAFAEKYPDAELAPLHLECVDEYGVTVLHVGMARITDASEA